MVVTWRMRCVCAERLEHTRLHNGYINETCSGNQVTICMSIADGITLPDINLDTY